MSHHRANIDSNLTSKERMQVAATKPRHLHLNDCIMGRLHNRVGKFSDRDLFNCLETDALHCKNPKTNEKNDQSTMLLGLLPMRSSDQLKLTGDSIGQSLILFQVIVGLHRKT